MLSREVVSGVACSFLTTYYREFVKENGAVALLELYADTSRVVYADYNEETPELAQGRAEIAQHLTKLDLALGRRKVEVRFVDSSPLPGGAVQIICQGILYLRGLRRAFFQVFVLTPTPYRANTYHIASDYFRVIVVEVEQIPGEAVIMTPAQVTQHLLEENERRKQLEEKRERLRLWQQQQEEEAERVKQKQLQQAELAAKQLEMQQARTEHGGAPRRGDGYNNNNYNKNNNNNNVNSSNHYNNNNNRWERNENNRRGGEPREYINRRGEKRPHYDENERNTSNGRREERGYQNGERRVDRYDNNRRGEHNNNYNTRTREEGVVPPAPRSTRAPRQRDQQNDASASSQQRKTTVATKSEGNDKNKNAPAAESSTNTAKPAATAVAVRSDSANNNNNNNNNNNRPVPRSKAAQEKRNGTKHDKNDGNNNYKKESTSAEKEEGNDKRPPRTRNPKNRTGNTKFARLLRVPKEVKLTDIKEVMKSMFGAEPSDAYWIGRNSSDCVVQLSSFTDVDRLVQDSVTVMDIKLSVAKFYTEE